MASRASISHEERTAKEPRATQLHLVTLDGITQVNENIRLLTLGIKDKQNAKFFAGQWLDTFIPGLPKAGGFTITSPPEDAAPSSEDQDRGSAPYLELAIQNTHNPPARWLSRPADEILHTDLHVRVGGSFTWPPPGLVTSEIAKLVLIAGGVGINPLMSICSHLHRAKGKQQIHVLYSTKISPNAQSTAEILFLDRLLSMAANHKQLAVDLFVSAPESIDITFLPTTTRFRRMNHSDISKAIGTLEQRAGTVCYICGPPAMTDEFVSLVQSEEGLKAERVLCEKWW